MASFKTMLMWLREGKKVRRPSWTYGAYLYLSKCGRILNDRKQKVEFSHINSLEADDYEICEEDESLSGKITEGGWLSCVEVSKAVGKLRDELCEEHIARGGEYTSGIFEIIKRNMGDELV